MLKVLSDKAKIILIIALLIGALVILADKVRAAEITWSNVDVQTVKIEAIQAVTVWDSTDGHTSPAQRITLTNSTEQGQLQLDVVNNVTQFTLTTFSKAWCEKKYEIETCYRNKTVQTSLDGVKWTVDNEVVTFP